MGGGGESESEARAELTPEVHGELASEVHGELASDGRMDGGGWSTSKS